MVYAAPIAQSAGASLEETSGILAILADNGIRGSIAGTSLRRIFTNLATQGKTMSQIFQENAGDIEKMGDAMGFAKDQVGQYALSSFLVLARNADLIDATTEAMSEQGTAARVANQQLTSLTAKLTILNSAWEALILTGESGQGFFGRMFGEAIDSATDFLNILSGISNEFDIASGKQSSFYKYTGREKSDGRGGAGGGSGLIDKEAALYAQQVFEFLARNYSLREQVYQVTRNTAAEEERKVNALAAESNWLEDILGTAKLINTTPIISDETSKTIDENIEKMRIFEALTKEQQSEQARFEKAFEKQRLERNNLEQKHNYILDEKTGLYSDVVTEVHKLTDAEKELIKLHEQEIKDQQSLALQYIIQQEEIQGITRDWYIAKNALGEYIKAYQLIQADDGKDSDLQTIPETADITIPSLEGTDEALKNQMQTYEDWGDTISQVLGQTSNSWEEYASNLGQSLLKMAADYLTYTVKKVALDKIQSNSDASAAAASGVKTGAKAAESLPPWVGLIALPALIALALGAITAGMGKAKQAKPFADGGIVSGTTYGMLGEYGNASTNPEVVAPLDKLRSLMGDIGGGGGKYELILKNRTLVAAMQRETTREKRYGAR
jgi:hypothetical protein